MKSLLLSSLSWPSVSDIIVITTILFYLTVQKMLRNVHQLGTVKAIKISRIKVALLVLLELISIAILAMELWMRGDHIDWRFYVTLFALVWITWNSFDITKTGSFLFQPADHIRANHFVWLSNEQLHQDRVFRYHTRTP